MRSPKALVGELFSNVMNWDISRGTWFGPMWNALRSFGTVNFFRRPIMEGTRVNYDLARSLYRNDNRRYAYGAGFVRPIIDLAVEYMGTPTVSSSSGDSDAFLNECIHEHWAPQLQQVFRDSMRDSKVVVRFRQPRLDNPLFTESDRQHGRIDVLPPESVDITFDPTDPDLIARAVVSHEVEIDERTDAEVAQGVAPRKQIHEVMEIITPQDYRFFDKSAGEPLDSWTSSNVLGFVPLWPVWNEYAADLGGGQSDIEPVLTFIEAFHEVMLDVLSAHKYHSIPKAKFQVKNVANFIENNWPGTLDPSTGRPREGAKIDWQGKEIMFFNVDEDGGFIEAKSVLGDSKTLLEFLIDCIAISSETPKWALLSANHAIPETDASVQPFEKKIARKRVQFSEPIVMICKMALVAYGQLPETQRVSWPPIRLSDLAAKGQAIQQLILGFDVATQHEWIADITVVKILGALFPEMNAPDIEKALAAKNVVPVVPAPAPASPTQGSQPSGNGNTSKNGAAGKQAAKRALATTGASGS